MKNVFLSFLEANISTNPKNGGHLGFWPLVAKPREIQLGKQQKWIQHQKIH